MHSREIHNARNLSLAEGLWGFGMGFIVPLTVMPLLLRQFGAGAVELGFFYSMASGGFLLTQPIGMFLSRHGAGKKRVLVLVNTWITLPVFIFMAAVVLILGNEPDWHRPVRIMLLGAFSLRMLSVGIILPLWQDWINALFRTENRGRVTGLYAAMSAGGVMVGTLIAATVRRALVFPENYACLLMIASIFFAASFTAMAFVDSGSVPQNLAGKRPSLGELIHRFSLSLRDSNFVHYLVARLLLTTGGAAVAFFAIYFQSEVGGGLKESVIIGMGAAVMLPQAVSSYWLGKLGDRRGHRWGVLVGGFAQVASIGTAYAGRGYWACLFSFLLLGIAYAAGWVSHQNFIYETCPHDNRIAHLTLSNLVLSPVVLLLPLGIGAIISLTNISWGLAICLGISVAGMFYLLFFVHEPRLIVIGQPRRKLPLWLRKYVRREKELEEATAKEK